VAPGSANALVDVLLSNRTTRNGRILLGNLPRGANSKRKMLGGVRPLGIHFARKNRLLSKKVASWLGVEHF